MPKKSAGGGSKKGSGGKGKRGTGGVASPPGSPSYVRGKAPKDAFSKEGIKWTNSNMSRDIAQNKQSASRSLKGGKSKK